jgi:ribose/xylose/arabinose/galactoside ABC-type transport system permease subunit
VSDINSEQDLPTPSALLPGRADIAADPLADDSLTSGAGPAWRQAMVRYGPTAAVVVILLVVTSLTVPNFLSLTNFLNVLQQMAIIGVVAIGMTFVILTAGIDLSVGAVLELTSVLCAVMLAHHISAIIAVVAAIVVGGVVGIINGLGYTLLKIQPFVMTLATLAITEGLALSFSNGSEVSYSAKSGLINFLGTGGIGRLSGEFVVFLALAILGWLTLRFLPFGRYVYAVGGSPETARLAGIRVKVILAAVYIICGCGAGIAGVMVTSSLGVGEPTAGSLTNLDAIAAVVIGGTSLLGGRGSIWGSVVGAFILALIADVLTLLGVSPYQTEVIRGCVIIAAVLVGSIPVLRSGLASKIGKKNFWSSKDRTVSR